MIFKKAFKKLLKITATFLIACSLIVIAFITITYLRYQDSKAEKEATVPKNRIVKISKDEILTVSSKSVEIECKEEDGILHVKIKQKKEEQGGAIDGY